jgi:hypothetical protein
MAPTYSLPTTHPARVIVVTGAQGGVDAGPTRVDDVFGGQSAQRDPTPVSPTTPQPGATERDKPRFGARAIAWWTARLAADG